jgi:hypothetical protein
MNTEQNRRSATLSTRRDLQLVPPLIELLSRPKFRLSRMFWIGSILFILGTGPLLTVILLAWMGMTKDPNPNPVGPGLLAFLTFWPSVVLIIIGVVQSYSRYKSGVSPGGPD